MIFMPILILVIAFAIFFTVTTRMRGKRYGRDFEDFIDEEREANTVKSRPIGEDELFVPDMSLFPIKAESADIVGRKQSEMQKRAAKKMIRFDAPMSNLELKHKYGTVNLEKVSEYEENFFNFIYAVNDWAQALSDSGDLSGARAALRGGVLSGAETSKTFTMLADIYFQQNLREEMRELYETIKTNKMPAKEKTWQYINDYYVKMGL